jgi:glycogen debranching enzyme
LIPRRLAFAPLAYLCYSLIHFAQLPTPAARVERFTLRSGGLELHRPTHAGAFFDVVGRRAALFGYENRAAEAWVYPLKVLDDWSLSFRLEGYPLEIDGRDIMASIHVRPEATTLVYAHAAFTVRQIMFAPIDEPGVVVLLDVQSTLPMAITASFRPRLRLMWPATSMTSYIGWDDAAHVYYLGEETRRYAGVIGCPLGRDVSVMPYQEEPRDVPNRCVIDVAQERPRELVPLVITASIEGRAAAKAAYDHILLSVQALYEQTADHFERLDRDTLTLTTPDPQLDLAFRWAKVGIDKGVATNPQLGTGLLAGFRTSGDSERPGFAWFFGRDALWTTLATTSEGDFATTRTALEFLRKYQRQDGKIPHEISQSAALVPWFDQYPYPWASADATPLYVIAHADYWRASGDREFIRQAWDSIVKAWRFSAATDTDGDGLIENTNVGHGWVEGGALYPPHEEIYLEGLWVAASLGVAELADVMHDSALASQARAAAGRARAAIEKIYWIDARSFYAFATAKPRAAAPVAEPGPNRARRQARLEALHRTTLIDEDTVLPAVPLWFEATQADRAQREIDHLASGSIATDWGSRIVSDTSELYDPLSYHYGSVWPLFTGWASVAAYKHGRPLVGFQSLMANALLTYAGALGDVTELLSGDFATPFGRSSHHQIWSEAMVVTPTVRGLLGLETIDGGHTLRFAPALPATWDRVEARGVRVGAEQYDLTFERGAGRALARIISRGDRSTARLVVSPAFPLDTRLRRVTVNGVVARSRSVPIGDIQHIEVTVNAAGSSTEVVFSEDAEGTEVYADPQPIQQGADNQGLRVIRAYADARALHVIADGRGGRAYSISVRTPRQLGAAQGVTTLEPDAGFQRLEIRFVGPSSDYVRREIVVPFVR